MARPKPIADKQSDRDIQALISANMAKYGKTPEEVAVKMRVSETTFRTRYRKPETFRIGEFRLMCQALNVSDEDIIKYLGGE